MSIWNHAYVLIDFLRLPRPQGERRKSIYSPSPSRSRFGRARLGLG